MAENEVEEVEERCHTLKLNIGPLRLNFNPVVTILSASFIWAFVSICMVYPEGSLHYMTICKSWITKSFTWFYIGSINIWVIFIIVVYFSKYGDLKLGKDEDEPEFNDASYFTMLFSAGIGVGLFYFGVAEPIYHYEPGGKYGNRYWGRYSDNQRSQDAINVTILHWGIHAWIVYVLVGLALGLVSHRKGLPMTIRSCFHPLIGNRIFGWMGDVVDIVSIVSTMFGICAGLGAGAMSLNSGLNQMNGDIKENTTNQTIVIWVITFFATMSVISGLRLGIRRLSELCFCFGFFIMLVILFYDNTFYLLNLFVQSIGYYFQNIIKLGFHTDAFAQLGNAPDGKESSKWMNGWTISYWGWWISWSPFVGMFIAKVSRGRTVRNFIRSTLAAPVVFTFLWFIIVGGAGLKMEREAAVNGINCTSLLGGTNSTEPADGQLFRLSCRAHSQMYFDLIQQYGHGVGKFLRIVSMISITMYFVTSSDSGSLVIDCLSANGSPHPPIGQRIFWALTEGATATALVMAGGKNGIEAMQTGAVASGLLYIPVLSLMCVSIWKLLKEEHGETSNENTFSVSLIEVIDFPSRTNLKRMVIGVFAPWWSAGCAAGKVYNKHPWRYMVTLAILFYGWVLFVILDVVVTDLAYIGWVVLFGFFAYVTGIRVAVRERFGISGNLVEDGMTVVFLYPFAVDQLDKHMSIEEQQKKDDPKRKVKQTEVGHKTLSGERRSFLVESTPEDNDWV